jgi:class 3 adenylate cyclase
MLAPGAHRDPLGHQTLGDLDRHCPACRARPAWIRKTDPCPSRVTSCCSQGPLRPPSEAREDPAGQDAVFARQFLERGAIGARTPLQIEEAAVDAAHDQRRVELHGGAAGDVVADLYGRVRFRIGVNLGHVIIGRNDIYGDGVNVAARLVGLAEPGGIVISSTAFDYAKRAEAGFRYIGAWLASPLSPLDAGDPIAASDPSAGTKRRIR